MTLCCCSFPFTVLLMFRFTCFHANQWTNSLSLSPRFRFRTGVPKLSLVMHLFSISIDEHVYPKISYGKKVEENNKNIFTNKHITILKIIFTDVCINISKWIITYVDIFFPFISNLKCTPSNRQGTPRVGVTNMRPTKEFRAAREASRRDVQARK